ncbi:UPF0175 family protein [candidate division KSB1 bacterium]|nr:UPF0175 family protein [candidate division KSB1 bacterium]MBL7095121.1 UPF0175 family protein [candidate division KSB1 bacterium]
MKALQSKKLTEMELVATVRAGLFESREQALQEAITTWLAVKPNIRLESAIELFKGGEVTLDKAAEIAGLNRWVFQDILIQRNIKIVIEADSKEKLEEKVKEIQEINK